MDKQIQSRLRTYSLVETYLRQAAKDVKPLTVQQLLSIPDIHRACGGKKQEVMNAVRLFFDKGVLVNFSEEKTPFASSAFTWKDDSPTPKFRVLNRRTKEERRKAEEMKDATQKDLLGAAMGANVPNKPVGQQPDYSFAPATQQTETHASMEAMQKFYNKAAKDISGDEAFKWVAAWMAARDYYKVNK